MKRIRVFEAIPEKPIDSRVPKHNDTAQRHHRHLNDRTRYKKEDSDPQMVREVVGDRSDTSTSHVPNHANIRNQKQHKIPPPDVWELSKEKQ